VADYINSKSHMHQLSVGHGESALVHL